MPQMTSEAVVPRSALLLGAAGLVPFVACTLQILAHWPLASRQTGPALYALTLYSAVILSFMGGAQWGLAVAAPTAHADWRRYGVSVLPAIVAWAGLWLGGQTGIVLTAAGFAALLSYDLWTVRQSEAPAWYGRLRSGLTAAVIACLAAVALWGPF